ncbi:MAG: ABC transporter permease [Thermoplasmatota archaeon]
MKKTFLKKGLRELWAHKIQYFLLALIIGLGVGMYASFNDFANYRKIGLDTIFSESNFMDLQITLNYGETMTADNVTRIFQENGFDDMVDEWEMMLVFDVFIQQELDGEMKITKGEVIGQMVPGNSSPADSIDVNTPLYYVDDPTPYSSDGADECYLERKFSKFYGFEPGDQIEVNRGNNSRKLTILEQVAVPQYFFVMREGDLFPSEGSFGVALVQIDVAMEIYDNGDSNETLVNDIVLTVTEDTDIDVLKDELQSAFEAKGVALKFTEKDENPSRYFLLEDYENDKNSQSMFPVIIFAISAFGLVMALRRMIHTHRPQIGIFKALGMKNGTIMIYFAIIGIFIAILGTIFGWLVSIPLNMVFNNLANQLLDFPVDEYQVTYIFYIYGALISIALCLACTLIPAALAVRVKPIDVIQGKEGVSKKQVGRLGGVMGRIHWLPVSLKLTARNVLRKPFKSLSTIFGVAMSLALLLSFIMVMDSAIAALNNTTAGLDWDYEVTMEGFQPHSITDSWDDTHSEIEEVHPAIKLPSIINPGDDDYGVLIYSVDDLQAVFDIDFQKGRISEGMAVVSWYHAKKMGLSTGDEISVELPILDPELGYRMEIVDIPISGIHSNHLGAAAFMTLATMQNITGLHGMINIAYLKTAGGEEVREIENDLITRKGVSSISYVNEMEGLLDQYLDILIGTVAVMAVISVLLAGAIIYTMFRISAKEQERDYATMKTLGTTLGKIGKLIFQEGAYITVWGLSFGVLGAYGLAYLMLSQSEEWEAFGMSVQFSWWGFALGSSLIIATVIIVSFLTIRYISRINIADVIRERSSG